MLCKYRLVCALHTIQKTGGASRGVVIEKEELQKHGNGRLENISVSLSFISLCCVKKLAVCDMCRREGRGRELGTPLRRGILR